MSLSTRVMETLMGPDAWSRYQACEKAFREDNQKFSQMTNEQLAETAQYYLHNCERPRWSRGEPVYDAIMVYSILPELIKRLRD